MFRRPPSTLSTCQEHPNDTPRIAPNPGGPGAGRRSPWGQTSWATKHKELGQFFTRRFVGGRRRSTSWVGRRSKEVQASELPQPYPKALRKTSAVGLKRAARTATCVYKVLQDIIMTRPVIIYLHAFNLGIVFSLC